MEKLDSTFYSLDPHPQANEYVVYVFQTPVTPEQTKAMAKKINADRWLECSSKEGINIRGKTF